jgi:methyl-accepting chemotaxis protein
MIVGIAGTFFSMVVLGNTNVENVQAVFKQALGNALPVGFVGILLTLIFYPVSGWLQSGLERAAAEATRKAIEYRGNRDFASAEILLNAFQAVAQLPPKLNSALEPLANLQKTLDTVLGRVLQGLDTKWTESSAKLEKHVEAVAVSIAALRLSVGTVGESLQGMSATLQETAQGAKELQALARESAKQVTQITQSTKELHQGVVESSEALGHAAAKLTEFPETARLELAQAFKDVASKSAPVWKELSDSFIGTLSNATAQEIQGIRSGAEAASKKLEDAATKLHEVAANLSDSVVRVIREAIEALKEPLQNFDATYRRDYPKLLKELKDTLSDTAKQSDRVESLIAASNLAGGNVDQLEKSWNRLSDKASNAADTLGRVARDLESALDRLNEVQGHWLALRLYPSQYKLAAGGK